MIWSALRFDFPFAAWLLGVIFPIFWIFFFLYDYRNKKLKAFGEPHVLEVIVEKRTPVFFWLKVLCCCSAWIFAVFALMQPKGNERYVSTSLNGEVIVKNPMAAKKATLRKKAHEVIFLIDASASMKIRDINGKSRLEIAKEIADDVIRHLKGENVSLLAFTSVTMQMVPSTLDYLFTRLILQQIEINEGETEGTDFKQALEFIKKKYLDSNSVKTKTLIVLSDGGDTQLQGLNQEQMKQAIGEIMSPLKSAAEKNLRVFSVGLASLEGEEVPGLTFEGKPVRSQLEKSLLQKLSAVGKGKWLLIEEMAPFQISQTLYEAIADDESFVDSSKETLPDRGNGTSVFDLYFQSPLALAILALSGYLFLPDTHRKKPMIKR